MLKLGYKASAEQFGPRELLGFSVLAAPFSPAEADMIAPKDVYKVMGALRKRFDFVVVDCGSIPPTLAESILFGHEKGSFTGANERRKGALAEADGGTLFFDELGELPIELQPKLLRRKRVRFHGH